MDAVFRTDKGVFNYRAAGVWIQDGHVLLHKQANDTHWALPGGRVHVMEASHTALRREFQEELGLDIEVEKFLWSTENFFAHNGESFQEIGFYYLVACSAESRVHSEEFFGLEGKRLVYQWHPVTTLKEISIYPEFLKEGIQNMPDHPNHIIVNDHLETEGFS